MAKNTDNEPSRRLCYIAVDLKVLLRIVQGSYRRIKNIHGERSFHHGHFGNRNVDQLPHALHVQVFAFWGSQGSSF